MRTCTTLCATWIHWVATMTKDEFDELLPLSIPTRVAVCPICSSALYIDEVSEWHERNGQMRVAEDCAQVSFDCTTAPDIDSEDWRDWFAGHWSTPYIDWLPLERPVTRWLDRKLRDGSLKQAAPTTED